MKLRHVFLSAAVALLLLLGGCAGKKDSLTFLHERASAPGQTLVSYDVRIGNEVGEAIVVAELWENGTCTQSAPLPLCAGTEKLSVSFLPDGGAPQAGYTDVSVQMRAGENAVPAHFALPDGVSGTLFSAYRDGETLPVSAGEAKVLCAMAFDTGSGVPDIDCAALSVSPDAPPEHPCLLIVRAEFAGVPANRR